MKTIIVFLMLLLVSGIAQDGSLISMADAQSEPDSLTVSHASLVERLELDDFKKFYIGFATKSKTLEVITLDIKKVAPRDSILTFQYTINTRDNRREGVGKIFPDQSIISFQNMEKGTISVPDDGKIVFESITQDSLNYWKLKEK